MLTTSLLISLGVGLACLAAAFYSAPFRQSRTVTPIPADQDTLMDNSLWPHGWPHEAPDRPLTVDEAHQAMRRHCGCLREECARKAAAYQVLIEEGRLKPDVSRAR